MTIASTTSKLLYNGDGSTTVFAISFVFWQNSDIKVVHRDANAVETEWAEGTQYSITGGSGGTGTLTVKTSPADYTPAAGEKLLIKSVLPETQGAALPLGGAFPSTTVEQMVDIVTRLVQQKTEEIARSILLPETASLSNLRLPEPGASQVVRYNAAGTDLETVAFGDISTAIDVLLSAVANGDLLVYDSGQSAWVNSSTLASLGLESADAGGAAGPLLMLDRNSASPAASDIMGALRFSGRNSAAETIVYAQAAAEIVDATDASEDGGLNLDTMVAGAPATRFKLRQGLYATGALDGDKGANTVNAGNFYAHGNILLPRGHIDGLILSNNGVDADHDIDISAGEAVDDAQAAMMALSSTLVKQIDATWAAGTNQGGLDMPQLDGAQTVTFNDNGGLPDDVTIDAGTWTFTPVAGDTLVVVGSTNNDGIYQITGTPTTTVIEIATGSWSLQENNSAGAIHVVRRLTWYHVWLIRRSDTGVVDALFSESATAPTMPTNYYQKRRIGAVATDGAANIVRFTQYQDMFTWRSQIQNFRTTDPGTARVLETMSVPAGIEVVGYFSFNMDTNPDSVTAEAIITSPQHADVAPSNSNNTFATGASGQNTAATLYVLTNNVGQVGYRLSASSAGRILEGHTRGWIDPRGRNS